MSQLENTKLTAKEVFYVVSVCSAFIFNWYSLKLEIQELAITKQSQDKITELKLTDLSSQVSNLRRDCDRLLQIIPQAYALKPKEIAYENEPK